MFYASLFLLPTTRHTQIPAVDDEEGGGEEAAVVVVVAVTAAFTVAVVVAAAVRTQMLTLSTGNSFLLNR